MAVCSPKPTSANAFESEAGGTPLRWFPRFESCSAGSSFFSGLALATPPSPPLKCENSRKCCEQPSAVIQLATLATSMEMCHSNDEEHVGVCVRRIALLSMATFELVSRQYGPYGHGGALFPPPPLPPPCPPRLSPRLPLDSRSVYRSAWFSELPGRPIPCESTGTLHETSHT